MNAPNPTDPVIKRAGIDGEMVRLCWNDGREEVIHGLWLRDNCPTAGDRNSAIRSFSLADLPDGFGIDHVSTTPEGGLSVAWRPDDHVSTFSPEWLALNLPGRASRAEAVTWTSARQQALSWLSHDDVMESETGCLGLLERVARDGCALIRGIPGEAATEPLLNCAGFVQENDFGRVFNIVSEPDVWELSQSDEALHVHTDDPYRHTPPGISLLHCVDASPEGGGVSVLVDGFAVAERFREDNPEGFRLLSQTPVPFIRYRRDPVPQGDDVHLYTEAPIISVDREGTVSGIRFHERSMAPLDLSPELMAAYYPALAAFTKLIYQPAFQIRHLLRPGEAIMFDNQRVLHGRTAFDGKAGRRHMRLTQTSRDQFHSRLRLLRARHGRAEAYARLPQGAGF